VPAYVEGMWLLERLQPDCKSIAEFRRMHSQAVTEAGVELVRFARAVGLVKGETVAVDGSKFRAVSSAKCPEDALYERHATFRLRRSTVEHPFAGSKPVASRPGVVIITA
jgi:hypothetical protein